MTPFRARALAIVASTLCVTACSSSTEPTPVVPPVVTPSAPSISCPALQTIQLGTTVTATPVTYPNPTTANGKAPLTTSCQPLSGSSFNIGASTVTCTTTDALDRTDSCTFGVTVLPLPVLTATSFVAFGDSITRGEDGNSPGTTPGPSALSALRLSPRVYFPDAQTYPGALQQSLAARYRSQSISVDNQGAPGESVTDTDPNTLSRLARLTASRQYGVALIMEGSNDLFFGTRDALIPQRALVILRQMVRDTRSRGVVPFLATIPPMNPEGSRGRVWGADLVPGFNDGVRAVALSEGVTLVDVYQGFGGDLSLLGVDGLHPNAAGYARIADVFLNSIKQTLETPAAAALGPARSNVGRRR